MMSEKWVQNFHADYTSLPRSWQCHVISMEFLHSIVRHHLARKPVINGVTKCQLFSQATLLTAATFLALQFSQNDYL